MAANPVPWSPQQHARFPPAFRHAARALLLAAQRGGSSPAGQLGGAAARRQRRIPSYRLPSAAGTVGLAALPQELLLRIVGLAAYPRSSWGGKKRK
jgi:hypothetical protein